MVRSRGERLGIRLATPADNPFAREPRWENRQPINHGLGI
jgi:hypothetical protein